MEKSGSVCPVGHVNSMTLIQGAIRIQARWTFQGWIFLFFRPAFGSVHPVRVGDWHSVWNEKIRNLFRQKVWVCFFENVGTCYVNVLPWLYWNTTALLGLQSSLFKRLWHRVSRSHHRWIVRPLFEIKALINDHCEHEKGLLIVKCSHIYFKSIWICCLFYIHPQGCNDKPLD